MSAVEQADLDLLFGGGGESPPPPKEPEQQFDMPPPRPESERKVIPPIKGGKNKDGTGEERFTADQINNNVCLQLAAAISRETDPIVKAALSEQYAKVCDNSVPKMEAPPAEHPLGFTGPQLDKLRVMYESAMRVNKEAEDRVARAKALKVAQELGLIVNPSAQDLAALAPSVRTKLRKKGTDMLGIVEKAETEPEPTPSAPVSSGSADTAAAAPAAPAAPSKPEPEINKETGEVVDVVMAAGERLSKAEFEQFLRDEGYLPPKAETSGKFEGVVDEGTFEWFVGLLARLHGEQLQIQANADKMKKDIEATVNGLKHVYGIGAKAYALDKKMPRKRDGSYKVDQSFTMLQGTWSFSKTGGLQLGTSGADRKALEAFLDQLTPDQAKGVELSKDEVKVVEYKYDAAKLLAMHTPEAPVPGIKDKGPEDRFGSWSVKSNA